MLGAFGACRARCGAAVCEWSAAWNVAQTGGRVRESIGCTLHSGAEEGALGGMALHNEVACVSAHGRRCHWVWHAPSATLDPYASMLSFNSGDGGHSGWRPVSGHVIVRSKESARPCSDLSVAFGRCVPVCVVHCSWYRGTGS